MLRSLVCPSKPSIHPRINLSHSASCSSARASSLSRPSRRCQPGSCCSARDGQPTERYTCSLQALSPGLSLLLAGSVVIHTQRALAGPLLLPPAARAVASAQQGPAGAAAPATVTHVQPSYTLSDAPSVHAEAEELQWWQQDQQVWHEIVSPAELSAFMSASQAPGPPAWPALDSAALSPKLRLVEFYASWCPACKAAAPGMAEVAGDPSLRQHCTFARVNIDRAKALVRQLGVTKIPTVLLLGPDGATLASFRASGQAARDAITQQLTAMQQQLQQQQQQQPSLPVLPPVVQGPEEEQPAPSEVDGSSTSNGNTAQASAGSAATCGVVPEPSCGSLPPDVAQPGSADARPSTAPEPAAEQQPGAASGSSSQVQTAGSGSAAGATDAALLAAKQQFLQQYGSGYGYGGWLDEHYQQEIGARLGPDKHYLDYTGAALYPASLLDAVYKDLLTHSYGNPHSAGPPDAGSSSSSGGGVSAAAPPAAASEAVMQAAAAAVLEHMHADPAEYTVVFTRSATEALKLVGEMFPWSGGGSSSSSSAGQGQTDGPTELDMLAGSQHQPQSQPAAPSSADANSSPVPNSSRSQFVYTRTNHNSVLGLGAYAAAAGAELVPQSDTQGMEDWLASLEQHQQQQQQGQGQAQAGGAGGPTFSLLAYPAEDNYAGVVFPLEWINRVHAASSPSQRILVLLDAAAYLPTHELDLSAHPADFVVASFYKMFGYPGGLGALVLRTEHVQHLNKVYFGGGSVALATPEGCWHVNKCDPAAALSDGTPNYLGAAALKLAYESWDSRGGMQAVQQHTDALSSWLYDQLAALHHSNGAPLIQLYGRHSQQPLGQAQPGAKQQQQQQQPAGFSQGAVFNFQVLQPDGQPVSFSRVDREATAAGIYLRSGCVCNPGACYDWLGLEAAEVQALAGLKEGCGDEIDFITVQRPAARAQVMPETTTSSSSGRGTWWPWQGAGGSVQQQASGPGTADDQGGVLVPTQVPLGSVRASLGWASTFEDAYALVQFLRSFLS